MGRPVLMSRAARAANMLDQVFGDLVVVDVDGKDEQGKIVYNCLCKCGNPKKATGADLRSGNVKSCGCLRTQTARKNGLLGGAPRKWLSRPFKQRMKWLPFKPCTDMTCWCATGASA